LNGLLAIALKISGIAGCSPEQFISGLFLLLGLLGAILLFHTVASLTGSLSFATFGLVLSVSDPSYALFQHLYFYPFLLHSLFLVALSVFIKVLRSRGDLFFLSIYGLLLGLIVYTSSLYHPIWAIGAFLLVLVMIGLIHRERRHLYWTKVAGITLFLVFLLTAWPLKNLILFDQYTYSTWTGYNLAHDTEVRSDVLEAFIFHGDVPAGLSAEIAEFRIENNIAEVDVIENSQKSTSHRNWNHYIFTKVNSELTKEAIQAKVGNPLEWLKTSLSNYMKWSRASNVDHISSRTLGPDNPTYNLYARIHRTIFFLDFRPLLEHFAPSLEGHWRFSMSGYPVPFTLFGLFTLPWIVGSSIYSSICMLRRRQFHELATVVVPLFTVLWVLIVPCLTDGSEGNRMRFSITPYLIVLAIMALRAAHGFNVRIHSRRVQHRSREEI
jgi:hypothetical protein